MIAISSLIRYKGFFAVSVSSPEGMVMEMCKKGVVMKVGLEEKADPYDDEQCRCWFRDHFLLDQI
jgi:hypothetical protein